MLSLRLLPRRDTGRAALKEKRKKTDEISRYLLKHFPFHVYPGYILYLYDIFGFFSFERNAPSGEIKQEGGKTVQ